MQSVFYRIEKKYLITQEVFEIIRAKIEQYMELDQHGIYTLCNIYYDTKDNELIRKSLEKPIYKEKLRLRSYNTPNLNSPAFVEIKKKYNGVVNKRRISLPLKEAYQYLQNGIQPDFHNQILEELNYFKTHYEVKPFVYISYDRIAYYDGDFRVTFDNNMLTRDYDLRLEKGIYGESILEEGHYIMEVKTIRSSSSLVCTHII